MLIKGQSTRMAIWTAVSTHVVAIYSHVPTDTAVTCSIANLYCRITVTVSVVHVTMVTAAEATQGPQGKESSHVLFHVR